MNLTRREVPTRLGAVAGAGVMLKTMTDIGVARASRYDGPPDLQGDPKGTSVLILGAGVAGMSAALELRQVGYDVKLLEYQARSGGRCWSLRGGDAYTELGGYEQECGFDEGLYINPGPWRIPYHHHAVLDYCKRLGVPLQTFQQINFNAYLHAKDAFGGKPQRLREVYSDFEPDARLAGPGPGHLSVAARHRARVRPSRACRSWTRSPGPCFEIDALAGLAAGPLEPGVHRGWTGPMRASISMARKLGLLVFTLDALTNRRADQVRIASGASWCTVDSTCSSARVRPGRRAPDVRAGR